MVRTDLFEYFDCLTSYKLKILKHCIPNSARGLVRVFSISNLDNWVKLLLPKLYVFRLLLRCLSCWSMIDTVLGWHRKGSGHDPILIEKQWKL